MNDAFIVDDVQCKAYLYEELPHFLLTQLNQAFTISAVLLSLLLVVARISHALGGLTGSRQR